MSDHVASYRRGPSSDRYHPDSKMHDDLVHEQIPTWVIEMLMHREMSPQALAVYNVLVYKTTAYRGKKRVNGFEARDGVADNQQELAVQCGMTRPTLRRYLEELQELRLVITLSFHPNYPDVHFTVENQDEFFSWEGWFEKARKRLLTPHDYRSSLTSREIVERREIPDPGVGCWFDLCGQQEDEEDETPAQDPGKILSRGVVGKHPGKHPGKDLSHPPLLVEGVDVVDKPLSPPVGGSDDGTLFPNTTPPSTPAVTASFEDWWKNYPREKGKSRGSKAEAKKSWARARKTMSPADLAARLANYVAARELAKTTYGSPAPIMHGSKFLNSRLDDWVEPVTDADDERILYWERACSAGSNGDQPSGARSTGDLYAACKQAVDAWLAARDSEDALDRFVETLRALNHSDAMVSAALAMRPVLAQGGSSFDVKQAYMAAYETANREAA